MGEIDGIVGDIGRIMHRPAGGGVDSVQAGTDVFVQPGYGGIKIFGSGKPVSRREKVQRLFFSHSSSLQEVEKSSKNKHTMT